MILILSHPADEHAMRVLEVLRREHHAAVLLDTAAYPVNMLLSERICVKGIKHNCRVDGELVDLDSCHSGWWRRPQPFTLHEGIDQNVAGFAYTECYEATAGLWAALDLNWMNQPELDEVAHHKPYQLKVATDIGLKIPTTLITNDPRAAREFAEECGAGRTIYKTFLATEQHWRETRILREEELDLLDQVQLAPVIFQELVPAQGDIRATVVGDEILAAEITQDPGAYSVDYRLDMPAARFTPTKLPDDISKKLRLLMRRLGLVYGAIDLRHTHDDDYVFLEVNPAGEWLFVEDRTHQPITDAVAHQLMKMDHV
jgi:glutathione synthase/RimK-type ligase-like ATP-grasp enzyme